MSLQDLRFISSSGEVITGRLPAQLRTDGPLTDEQLARVAHLYDIFLANKRAAIGGDEYFVMNKVVDGLAVRMISIRNVDTVTVRGAGKKNLDLPHGFAVRANWYRPFIYRRKPTNPPQWSLDGIIVPQAERPIAVDSQAFVRGDRKLCHPSVFASTGGKLWDWAVRSVGAYSAGTYPFALAVGSTYRGRQLFFAYEDKIYSAGQVVYTAAPTASILTSSPESPAYLHADSSANGAYVMLNHVRQALVSESAGISWMRFGAERVKRNTEGVLTRDQLASATLVVPHPVNSTAFGTNPGLGEELADAVWMKHNYIAFIGISWGGPSAYVGWAEEELPNAKADSYIAFDLAQRDIIVPDDIAVSTTGALIKLPTDAGSHDVRLIQHPNYPTRMFWRGGEKERRAALNYDSLYPAGFYGVEKFKASRIDMEFTVRGAPDCRIDLGWDQFQVLSGTTTGDFDGAKHVNTYTPRATTKIWENAFAVTWVTPIESGNLPDGTPAEQQAWCAEHDIREQICVPIAAKYYASTQNVEVLRDKRPRNTGSYSLTSRHIIDYDHKARFWAAIEVTVACSGASWKEGGAYWGDMTVEQNPTYEVTIALRWRWGRTAIAGGPVNGVTLLATASATRPAFEFATFRRWNPYYYGAPGELLYPVYVRMPPYISLPIEAMQQLKTLAKHQGFNDALAAEDAFPDMTSPQYAESRSSRGIEFSTVSVDGRFGMPHSKFVTGMLYARTFRLADVQDALWLLTKTRCDAKINGNELDTAQPSWYYMPALKNTIDNTKFHIELRDGALVQWSDEIPLGFGAAPDAEDREISLHRV